MSAYWNLNVPSSHVCMFIRECTLTHMIANIYSYVHNLHLDTTRRLDLPPTRPSSPMQASAIFWIYFSPLPLISVLAYACIFFRPTDYRPLVYMTLCAFHSCLA